MSDAKEVEHIIAPEFSLVIDGYNAFTDERMPQASQTLEVLPSDDVTHLQLWPGQHLNHCCVMIPTNKMREFIAVLTEAMNWYDAGCCDETEYIRPRAEGG